MSTAMVIRGAGGGKGGGGGGGAVEAPDSLRSKQYARLLDMLGEGEIEGLVDGLKSIYLDGTPLQNADGTFNFQDVTVATRNGTQAQTYIPGFNAAESVTDVSTEVLATNSVTRTITDPNVNAVRVTITCPQMTKQDTTNGNLDGSSAEIAIDLQSNGGGFVEVLTDLIKGKTTSAYQRNYRVNLTGAGPWDIRVRRITPDSAVTSVQNKTIWSDYTALIDQKLRYPNSALVGISIDASQFSGIPSRGYDVKLLKVLVPSNYFPLTRKYTRSATTGEDTGVPQAWDGSFYVAWSDNPAWCWYDLVTSERYGLGDLIDPAMVDKWQMYTIGKYCDELVPDGFGGMEPRFTCNIYLQPRQEAYKVINSLAAVFRGMSFWAGGGMTATQDAPADPVALFTSANVVDGLFRYSGSALKARRTVALVTWNDPANEYKQKVEYVEDQAGIARYGVVQAELVAVGCASRGQAHRVGKWLLFTERMETEIVTFKAGLDRSHLYPGAVIMTQDASRAGKRLGGRVLSATAGAVTIDAPIDIELNKTYTLSVVLPDGSVEERPLSNAVGSTSVLTPATALTTAPQAFAIWVVSVNDLVPELWRVVALKETSKVQAEIVAVEHNPEKYDMVEYGIAFDPAPTTSISTASPPPTNITASTHVGASGALDIVVSWDAAEGTKAATVLWRNGDDNFESATVYTNTFTIKRASIGTYTILVSTVNALGSPSPKTEYTYNVVSAELLPDVTGLALKQPFVDQFASFEWDALATADGYMVQVVVSGVVKREVTVPTNWFNYHYADSKADGGGTPFRSFDLRVKAKYGTLLSGNWITMTASNAAPPAPAVTVTAITGGLQASAPLPPGSDYSGMLVWVSQVNGFTPGEVNLEYDGPNNSTNIIGLTAGVPHYVKVAFYDVFGKTGLNVSPQYTVEPLSNTANLPVVASLPVTASEGEVVYLTTDGKLYRYDGTEWTSAVSASDIAGQLAAAQIADGTISAAKLAANTHAVITVDALPTLPSGSYPEGALVFLTTTDKLYRSTGIAWTASVPTTDLTGTVVAAQIATNAVTADKIFANAVTSAKIAAGAVTADKIAIGNFTNLVENNSFELGDVNWTKGSGWTIASDATNAYVGAWRARHTTTANTPITNTYFPCTPGQKYKAEARIKLSAAGIGSGNVQIWTKNAAGTEALLASGAGVTATAYALSSTEGIIPAGAVSVAVKVYATNTTGYIYADDVWLQSSQVVVIEDGSITAEKLATDSVVAGKIAAGAVNTAALQAGSVVADRINVTSLSSLSANLGTMTAGNITVDTAGFVRGGSTGYLTGTGFWMGYHSGAYKFHIGDPTGQFMAWTGTGLTVNASGTFSGSVVAGGVELGKDVGPGTGHHGLSLSPDNFNNIFIKRDDGVVFFRVNSGGQNGIDFDSASGVLNIRGGGQFSGTLTASAINAVNTINIAGNAVTISNSNSGAVSSGDFAHTSIYLPIASRVLIACEVKGAGLGSGSAQNAFVSVILNTHGVLASGYMAYDASIGDNSADWVPTPITLIRSLYLGAGWHTLYINTNEGASGTTSMLASLR